MIKYLGDTDTLLDKLNTGASTYGTKIIASIKGKITGNEGSLDKYVDDLMSGDKNSDARKNIKMFGDMDAIANTTGKLYYTDKDGNLALQDKYKDLSLQGSNYKNNSWAKVIAENVFDIDTSDKTKDEVDEMLFNAMKTAAVSSGMWS